MGATTASSHEDDRSITDVCTGIATPALIPITCGVLFYSKSQAPAAVNDSSSADIAAVSGRDSKVSRTTVDKTCGSNFSYNLVMDPTLDEECCMDVIISCIFNSISMDMCYMHQYRGNSNDLHRKGMQYHFTDAMLSHVLTVAKAKAASMVTNRVLL